MSTTDSERVEQIRARVAAASKGPWRTYVTSQATGAGVEVESSEEMLFWDGGGGITVAASGDANFVAHARDDVPFLLALLAEQAATIERQERDLGEEIDERDRRHDVTDRLAYAVAPMEEIGEHSSGNCPWENAIEAVDRLHARLAKQTATIERATALLHDYDNAADRRTDGQSRTVLAVKASLLQAALNGTPAEVRP